MNQFDKQRIANAIWTLEQYMENIEEILKSEGWDSWDIDHAIYEAFRDIKRNICA